MIDFPNAPSVGAVYASGGTSWAWDGVKWTAASGGSVAYAPLASPTFSGDPKAPTPATADNDTSIATTAYVQAQGYATSAAMTTADSLRVLKAGDTMTGNLRINNVAGSILHYGNSSGSIGGGGGGFLYGDGSSLLAQIKNASQFMMLNESSAAGFTFAPDTGVAVKPGGGAWAAPSDVRLKAEGVISYERGLDAVLALRPVVYRYNGKGGTTASDTAYVGLVADEVEPVMPEMVGEMQAKLDPGDEAPTALKTLDVSALTFALVNAVQELTARLAVLEGKPA